MTTTLYAHGKRSGYDPHSRRYRTADGKIISKRQFNSGSKRKEKERDYGFFVLPSRLSLSRAMDKVHDLVARGEAGDTSIVNDPDLRRAAEAHNTLVGFAQPDSPPAKDKKYTQPIPAHVRAGMNLAKYYCNTNGDVFQFIEAPLEVAVNELDVQCPDTGVKREIEDWHKRIGMRNVLAENWMCAAQYGIAFPWEIWEDGEPTQIFHLPPWYVWVGYNVSYGVSSTGVESPVYGIRPLDGTNQWSQELLDVSVMPMTYNSWKRDQNEQLPMGWAIDLSPAYLKPVRALGYSWERYPLPPQSRANRAMSTRTMYDEMVRATLEGFRNQLWVILLEGMTKDEVASPAEMAALRSQLEGMSGERTGYLLWRSGLKVEQHAPKGIETALAPEVRQAFNLEIGRQLGANLRVVTGNGIIGQGAGTGTGLDIDLSIWLKRLEYPRRVNLEWEENLRARWAKAKGGKFEEANKKTKVTFSRSLLENSDLIKNELAPFFSLGLLGPKTTLEKAGYNYDAVLADKKETQKDAVLFEPPKTYQQGVVHNDGEGDSGKSGEKSTSATKPQGRTPNVLNPNKVQASYVDDPGRSEILEAVKLLVGKYLADTYSPEEFISSLRLTNEDRLGEITERAYRGHGGLGHLAPDTLGLAANFVNAFADGFLSDLLGISEDDRDIEKITRRALLYPQEGYKMAVLNGQMAAMEERGARYWRRVIHPERSAQGVCPLCLADSQIIHAITEPFTVMHPNDVCDGREIGLQYLTGGYIPSIEVPVPNLQTDSDALLSSMFESNGKIIRRTAVGA